MINETIIENVLRRHAEGRSQRWLAKHFKISRHLVRKITGKPVDWQRKNRVDKILIPEDELIAVYEKCERWAERTHEELTARGYKIAYSTLTKRLREISDYNSSASLSQQYKISPGEEFQHDTSPIWVTLGKKKVKLQASSLIFRFSRIQYLKFYTSFTRFEMQCFFHEALMSLGYSAKECIIDNTNLAVLKGSGREAVFVPEMEMFAKTYSFSWIAHEIKHSDRKATVEASFRTVNCNFLPGREFADLEDLNEQAVDWCNRRFLKPVSKVNQTPEVLFALEKPHLFKLSPHLVAPYKIHSRKSDQYGFVSFRANFYYVGIKYCVIELLEFSKTIKIYRSNKLLWKYDLIASGVKGQQVRPPIVSSKVKTIDKSKKSLRALKSKLQDNDPIIKKFLERSFVMVPTQRLRNTLVRHLEKLYELIPNKIFLETLKKALEHDIFDKPSIDRLISIELLNKSLPSVNLDNQPKTSSTISDFKKRDVYQKFEEMPNPDLDKYTANPSKGNNDDES